MWAADAMTAYQAAIGILTALWARERSGQGQKVEVNMLATVMDCQAQELTTYLNMGITPQRSKAQSAHAWVTAPYGVYRTADSYITLAQSPIDVLGEALDSDDLRAMTAWSDGVTRRDEVYSIVSKIMPRRTTDEWLEILYRYKLWAGPVYTYADLANDPHVIATGMIATIDHPTIGKLRMPNIPLHLSETPAEIRLPPPLLGEHTDTILREQLGYDDDHLARLHEDGAI
jgi:crotonobetainyl-CoA:carnitine CoA-transferase CaiB-like acyl-CoA transferase